MRQQPDPPLYALPGVLYTEAGIIPHPLHVTGHVPLPSTMGGTGRVALGSRGPGLPMHLNNLPCPWIIVPSLR